MLDAQVIRVRETKAGREHRETKYGVVSAL